MARRVRFRVTGTILCAFIPSQLLTCSVMGSSLEMSSRQCLVPSSLMRSTVLFPTPLVCPHLLRGHPWLVNRGAAGDFTSSCLLGAPASPLHVHGSYLQ